MLLCPDGSAVIVSQRSRPQPIVREIYMFFNIYMELQDNTKVLDLL